MTRVSLVLLWFSGCRDERSLDGFCQDFCAERAMCAQIPEKAPDEASCRRDCAEGLAACGSGFVAQANECLGMPCGAGPQCVACGPAKRCYEEPHPPKGEPWLQCITFCDDDSYCDPGFHCDPAYGTCVEGEPP